MFEVVIDLLKKGEFVRLGKIYCLYSVYEWYGKRDGKYILNDVSFIKMIDVFFGDLFV